jgi:hypothetical protein
MADEGQPLDDIRPVLAVTRLRPPRGGHQPLVLPEADRLGRDPASAATSPIRIPTPPDLPGDWKVHRSVSDREELPGLCAG